MPNPLFQETLFRLGVAQICKVRILRELVVFQKAVSRCVRLIEAETTKIRLFAWKELPLSDVDRDLETVFGIEREELLEAN